MAGTIKLYYDSLIKEVRDSSDNRGAMEDLLSNLNNETLDLTYATKLSPVLETLRMKRMYTEDEKIKNITDSLLAKVQNIISQPHSLTAAGENLQSSMSESGSLLQNYGEQITGGPNVGLRLISDTTIGLKLLQEKLNIAMKTIIDTQSKFEIDSKNANAAELARLSAEADAITDEQTQQIMGIYNEMGKAAARLARQRNVMVPDILAIQTKAAAELNEIRKIKPSSAAKLQVWYNKFCRPYLRAVYGELPDPIDAATTTMFATALIGSGIAATTAIGGPTLTAATTTSLINWLAPVPLANPAWFFPTCNVLTSGLFGGISLACLVALLSNPTTSDAVKRMIRGTKTNFIRLKCAAEDAVVSLKNSVERKVIEGGYYDYGQGDDYAIDIKEVQDQLNKTSDASNKLKKLAKQNGIPCGDGGCNINDNSQLQLVGQAISAASTAQNTRTSPSPHRNNKGAGPGTYPSTETGMANVVQRLEEEAFEQAIRDVLGDQEFDDPLKARNAAINAVRTAGVGIYGKYNIDEARVIFNSPQTSSSSSSSSSSAASGSAGEWDQALIDAVTDGASSDDGLYVPPTELVLRALDETGGDVDKAIIIASGPRNNNMISSKGGRRKSKQRKTKQRKTKQRKTKRQVKRRSQTKKGKKRSQTKKVVKRRTLLRQNQNYSQNQRMSKQQMQKLMMQQQLMKYNQQNVQQY